MHHFPAFLNLKNRNCLVVGGGVVGSRKVKLLLEAGASVTVVAPTIVRELQTLADQEQIDWLIGDILQLPLEKYWLIVAATNNQQLNAQIAHRADEAIRWCNVVDNLEQSNFIVPAIIDRAPVTIAISSAGKSPVLVRMIKAKIEQVLSPSVGQLAEFAGQWRRKVKEVVKRVQDRRYFWQEVLTSTIADEVTNQKLQLANHHMQEKLSHWPLEQSTPRRGKGYLVGAGPGSLDLITVKGRTILETADVVLYDQLISSELLSIARRDAELIYVGKQCAKPSENQQTINDVLVAKVSAGFQVCRLKGGDSLIFGRGGEEVAALRENNLDFEIVPGITAAIGCAAYSGIPLTHRGTANQVTFITARGSQGDPKIDWRALAADNQTVVFYMGVRRFRWIASQLMQAGTSGDRPCAIVSHGTTASQSTTVLSVAELSRITIDPAWSPAVLIVGEVAKQALTNAWYGNFQKIQESLMRSA